MKFRFQCIILMIVFLGGNAFAQPFTKFLPKDLKDKIWVANECFEKTDSNCFTSFYTILGALDKESGYQPFVKTSIAIQLLRKGEMDSTVIYLDKATKEIAEGKIKNDTAKVTLQADISNVYAEVYYMQGKLEKAIEASLTYIKLLEKYGSAEQKINAKMNLASIYSVSENQEMSIKINLEAYNELERINSTSRKSTLAANLATSYFELQDYTNTKTWAKRAIELGNQLSYINSVIMGNYILGACFEKANQFDSASIYLEKSIELARANNRPSQLSGALQVYGNVLNAQKKYAAAEKIFNEAITIQKEQEDEQNLIQSYLGVGRANFYLGRFKESATYLLDYADKNTEILSEENREKVHQLNAKYEAEKKEKLIAEKELLIQKKNAQFRVWLVSGVLIVLGLVLFLIQYRKAQKATLQKAEQEKENAVLRAWMNGEERERNRISQDLHDGVAAMIGAAKMNLQAIPYLNDEKRNDQIQKVSNILENTHTDVRRIAHNLLPITLQNEGLVPAIRQFAKDINDTGIIQIEVVQNIAEFPQLNQQTQLMLFRIIQELSNNIIKHAQATKATIIFSKNKEMLQVEVKDNGKGMAQLKHDQSQGLYSIRQRLKALGGAFDINSIDNEGTSAILQISIS